MGDEPTPTDLHFPTRGDTAPVHDVTPEMMERVARQAALLADGVAHGTVPHDDGATGASNDPMGLAPSRDAAPGAPEAPAAPAPTAAEGSLAATPGAVPPAAGGGADPRRDPDPERARPVAPLQSYNAKVLDIVQSNMEATGAFLTALAGARTLPEAVQVNVDHATRGLQMLTGQGRELAELAQKVALEALRPFDGTRGG